MAIHTISILGGADMTGVEGCRRKGIELHDGARRKERLRRAPFLGLV